MSASPTLSSLSAALRVACDEKADAAHIKQLLGQIASQFQQFQQFDSAQSSLPSSPISSSPSSSPSPSPPTFTPVLDSLHCVAECCQRTTDLILLNLLYTQLLTLCRLPSVLHQLRDVPSPSSPALLLAVCDGLLQRLSATLLPLPAVVQRESDGGKVRNTLKVARFFLIQLSVLSTSFPAQLALRSFQPALQQASSVAIAIIASPPSSHRHQLWRQYRDVLQSKLVSTLVVLLSSPHLPLEQQRQLCDCLMTTTTSASDPASDSARVAAAAVSRAYCVSSLLASSRELALPALSVLFHSLLPTVMSDLPHCWLLTADLATSTAEPVEESTTAPISSLFPDLLEQVCSGTFTLLSAILSSLSPVDNGASQPLSSPAPSTNSATTADVELFLWRSMGSSHPLCARLSTLLWARALTAWEPSFRSRQLHLAMELLGMEQGEGGASLDSPLAPGKRVVCDWLACVLPLFDVEEQQRLWDAMDVPDTLLWHAASPPISLLPTPPSPAAPSSLHSSQSSSLTPTQVVASSQPSSPPSPILISVSINLLSHLHLPSLHATVQAAVCRSTLSTVAHLLLQCMTPAAVSSTSALSLVTALLRVLGFLLQSSDVFEAVFPTVELRAAELQPIILSLARLFSVPRAGAAGTDAQRAQPPLFPTFLAHLSTSPSSLAVSLLPALCSLFDSFLLHHVALPPLLKILQGLSSLLSAFPFLRLLLPPILVRLSSAPLVQQPTVPITAQPNQQLLTLLTSLWHAVLTPDPSSSTTSLTDAVAIPSLWSFTSALSTSPFRAFASQLLPPAHHATLIAALQAHSERVGRGAVAAQGEEQLKVQHWQAHLLLQATRCSERTEGAEKGRVEDASEGDAGGAGVGMAMDGSGDGDGVAAVASALAALDSARMSREAVLSSLRNVAALSTDERQRLQKLVEAEREEWLRVSW